jgi:hypothetical protein
MPYFAKKGDERLGRRIMIVLLKEIRVIVGIDL